MNMQYGSDTELKDVFFDDDDIRIDEKHMTTELYDSLIELIEDMDTSESKDAIRNIRNVELFFTVSEQSHRISVSMSFLADIYQTTTSHYRHATYDSPAEWDVDMDVSKDEYFEIWKDDTDLDPLYDDIDDVVGVLWDAKDECGVADDLIEMTHDIDGDEVEHEFYHRDE